MVFSKSKKEPNAEPVCHARMDGPLFQACSWPEKKVHFQLSLRIKQQYAA